MNEQRDKDQQHGRISLERCELLCLKLDKLKKRDCLPWYFPEMPPTILPDQIYIYERNHMTWLPGGQKAKEGVTYDLWDAEKG